MSDTQPVEGGIPIPIIYKNSFALLLSQVRDGYLSLSEFLGLSSFQLTRVSRHSRCIQQASSSLLLFLWQAPCLLGHKQQTVCGLRITTYTLSAHVSSRPFSSIYIPFPCALPEPLLTPLAVIHRVGSRSMYKDEHERVLHRRKGLCVLDKRSRRYIPWK